MRSIRHSVTVTTLDPLVPSNTFMTTVITPVKILRTFFKAVFMLPRHDNAAFITHSDCSTPVVPKMCYADPKGSAACFQGMGGYTSVMANVNFTFLIKGTMLC